VLPISVNLKGIIPAETTLNRRTRKPDGKNIWLFLLVRIDQKQPWWNKHESDVVWKSMKHSKQRLDQDLDTSPALDLGETEFSSIVAAGGGKYVGVLKEIPNKMESIVLFNSPRTRTTLGIRISSLTADAVREHLAESDAAFAEKGAK
jgi:hypothetical protein